MYIIEKQQAIPVIEKSKRGGNYLSLSKCIKVDHLSNISVKIKKVLDRMQIQTYTFSNKQAKKFIRLLNNEIDKNSVKILHHSVGSTDYLLKINTNLTLHFEILESNTNHSLHIWIEGILINENTSENDINILYRLLNKFITKIKEYTLLFR